MTMLSVGFVPMAFAMCTMPDPEMLRPPPLFTVSVIAARSVDDSFRVPVIEIAPGRGDGPRVRVSGLRWR
jgi:hypothetical protein